MSWSASQERPSRMAKASDELVHDVGQLEPAAVSAEGMVADHLAIYHSVAEAGCWGLRSARSFGARDAMRRSGDASGAGSGRAC